MLVLTIPARERPLSPSVSSHHLPEDIFQKLWKSLTFCQYQESQWLAKVRNSVWDVEGVGMRDSLMVSMVYICRKSIQGHWNS